MDPHRLFPPSPTSPPRAAKLAYGHLITCTTCGSEHVLSAGAKSGPAGLPDDVVMNKMRQQGWTIRRRGKKRECPACCGGQPRGTTDGGGKTRAVAHCCIPGCEAELALPRSGKSYDVKGGKVLVPLSVAVGALRAAGWREGLGDHSVCPLHAKAYSAGVTYLMSITQPHVLRQEIKPRRGQTREAYEAELAQFLAYADSQAAALYGEERWERQKANLREQVAREAQQKEEERTMAAAAAEAARTPTRDEKRRIVDALNERYDGTGYAGDWTDKRVAADLNLPVAWVAAIRVEFFGDDETNEAQREADKARLRAVHELRRDLDAAKGKVESALATLADADRLYAGLEARLAKLEG